MIEFDKRSTIEAEDKYTFRQSQQISSQCGLIGYLRADMGTDGKGFFSSWFDNIKDLKTDEFKSEFDDVLNSLREEGDILHNRRSLASYCYSHPQCKMNTDREYYGVRVDTEKYTYLLRLTPENSEYNLYCYCYRKDMLDSHLKQAEKGIRFITPSYKELFKIPDGDMIRILDKDGSYIDEPCRYIDDYHLEVGHTLYHICQFAEIMEANGNKVIPLRSSLPDHCFSVLEETGEMIIIKKGEQGFYKSDLNCTDKAVSRTVARENNKRLGVSERQENCMLAGSMFGWDKPAADLKNYDKNGKYIKPKNKDRGDAR